MRFRIILLFGLVFFIGGLLVLTVISQEYEYSKMVKAADFLANKSFQLSDQYSNKLYEIETSFLALELSKNEKDKSSVTLESAELLKWLEDNIKVQSDLQVVNLLEAIRREFITFQHDFDQYVVSLGAGNNEILEDRARVNVESELYNLQLKAEDLAKVQHHDSRDILLEIEQSIRRTSLLSSVLIGSLAVMLVWQAIELYRKYVIPLRIKVVEQEEMISRQEKVASLGMLAAEIAHEVRTPLAALKARMFTLKKDPGHSESSLEDIEVLGAEINRLEFVVNKFLKMTRVPEPELRPCGVDALLCDIKGLFESLFLEREISIVESGSVDDPIKIDYDQAKQCLINIMQNAADSMNEGGLIELSKSVVDGEGFGRSGEFACISIKDNGSGLDHEQQKRLFDPFFTTKKTGTGLGLALTQIMVEKQNGFITFQSVPEKGTVFNIHYPLAYEKS